MFSVSSRSTKQINKPMWFALVVNEAVRNQSTHCPACVSWSAINLKNWNKFILKDMELLMHSRGLKAVWQHLLCDKHDEDNFSHYRLSPFLSENMTMAGLFTVAKCPVGIFAHLNPLDQTRRTKCKLAVTLPPRKQVNIGSMCSRCVANAINMVLKFCI